MNTTQRTLYPIGDVAHRTGLAVSAIRFYSDEGIVEPAEVTASGHRLYDVHAIVLLELVRTLRDLDTGLEKIRRLLAGEMTLHHLLAEHLELVERQEGELRVRRAVLRALVRKNDPAERAALLRRLVTMPDDARERLVDEFWSEVAADLPADFADRLQAERPQLPDDPTVEQLEAWVELAELVQDQEFRRAVRSYFYDVYATGAGPQMTAPGVQDFIASSVEDLTPKIIGAFESGLDPQSPHAQHLATRYVEETAAAVGVTADDALWERMAAHFPVIGEIYEESLDDPEYDASHGRYLALVAVINGTGAQASVGSPRDVDMPALGRWLASAMNAARQAGSGPTATEE